jgi:phosphatidate cytidylyltransferase
MKKGRNALIRSFWGSIMVAFFYWIINRGPIMVIALVSLVQALVYREVIQIGIVPSKERDLPWYRSLHWFLNHN